LKYIFEKRKKKKEKRKEKIKKEKKRKEKDKNILQKFPEGGFFVVSRRLIFYTFSHLKRPF